MNFRRIVGPVLTLALLLAVGVAINHSIQERRQTQLAQLQASARSTIRVLSGSEKEHFFEDPSLLKVLASHGMGIDFQKAGSREIATRPDLKTFDVAFPAGAHAAVKIAQTTGSKRIYTAFYTPIAVASWRTLLPTLEKSGLVARRQNAYFIVDMGRLLDLMEQGERWKDLPGNDVYPVSKSVLVTSTDVRKSNSGAMYLALCSYLSNGNNVVDTEAEVQKIAPKMISLFSRQGYQESSSAGPFEDYTAMGIGKAPLVLIYEQQFLEYVLSHQTVNPDMVLLYPEPTILTKHTIVALTDNGARFAEELVSDPKIISIAQRYGFRTQDSSELFAAVEAKKLAVPHTLVNVIDPPRYDILESLINQVDAGLK